MFSRILSTLLALSWIMGPSAIFGGITQSATPAKIKKVQPVPGVVQVPCESNSIASCGDGEPLIPKLQVEIWNPFTSQFDVFQPGQWLQFNNTGGSSIPGYPALNQVYEFRVSNIGTQNLSILKILPPRGLKFASNSYRSGTLRPQENQLFQLTYDLSRGGDFVSTLVIQSSDPRPSYKRFWATSYVYVRQEIQAICGDDYNPPVYLNAGESTVKLHSSASMVSCYIQNNTQGEIYYEKHFSSQYGDFFNLIFNFPGYWQGMLSDVLYITAEIPRPQLGKDRVRAKWEVSFPGAGRQGYKINLVKTFPRVAVGTIDQ